MPTIVNCQCGKRYRVSDSLRGRSVRCKACGQAITIAAADPPTPDVDGPIVAQCSVCKKNLRWNEVYSLTAVDTLPSDPEPESDETYSLSGSWETRVARIVCHKDFRANLEPPIPPDADATSCSMAQQHLRITGKSPQSRSPGENRQAGAETPFDDQVAEFLRGIKYPRDAYHVGLAAYTIRGWQYALNRPGNEERTVLSEATRQIQRSIDNQSENPVLAGFRKIVDARIQELFAEGNNRTGRQELAELCSHTADEMERHQKAAKQAAAARQSRAQAAARNKQREQQIQQKQAAFLKRARCADLRMDGIRLGHIKQHEAGWTYEVYRSKSRALALRFLESIPPARLPERYYVIVETPEGNVGRDCEVVFDEDKERQTLRQQLHADEHQKKPQTHSARCAHCGAVNRIDDLGTNPVAGMTVVEFIDWKCKQCGKENFSSLKRN